MTDEKNVVRWSSIAKVLLIGVLAVLFTGCGEKNSSKQNRESKMATPTTKAMNVSKSMAETLFEGSRHTGRLSASSDRLSDGSYAESFRFEGDAGFRYRAVLSSADFDSYLIVANESNESIAEDDDSGGGLDAAATFRMPASGSVTILANTLTTGETGAFELSIQQIGALRRAELPAGNRSDGRYAMVVGVSEYANPADNLPLVANDTKAMVKMLNDELEFEDDYVYVLEDDMATRENILNGLSDFLGRAGPDGTVVFYFSGHGTRAPGNYGLVAPVDIETDEQDEALVAHDEIILDDEIGISLQRLNAGQIVVFYDSCNAGTGVRGAQGQPKFLDNESAKAYLPVDLGESLSYLDNFGDDFKAERLNDRMTFIASSKQEELSWVADDYGMSIYTYMITEMLPRNLDRSVADFVQMISDPVNQYTTATFGQEQTPNLESHRKQATLREILGL